MLSRASAAHTVRNRWLMLRESVRSWCKLTFDSFGNGPEVGTSVDIPLGVTSGLRRKRLESVLGVTGGMVLMALVA